MNLVTEYASRSDVAIQLLKLPCSVVAVADKVENGKNTLKSRVLTVNSVNEEELMFRLYGTGTGELPELLKEKVLLRKKCFDPESLKSIFSGCRMVPYTFSAYPAENVVNDPPQSQLQETAVLNYFKTYHNSTVHQEYRRMVVWCAFVSENASSVIINNYGEKTINGMMYINPENVKRYEKKTWTKWENWHEKLYLKFSSDWATEILFAKCLPRMNKKDMNLMSMPISEDVA